MSALESLNDRIARYVRDGTTHAPFSPTIAAVVDDLVGVVNEQQQLIAALQLEQKEDRSRIAVLELDLAAMQRLVRRGFDLGLP